MTTAYTSLLGLALPVSGELSGTWGDTVNDYITKYVDAAVAGAQTISGSQTAVTLSTTTGSTLISAGSSGNGSAQYAIINCTGNPASLLTITAPATSKAYLVLNGTSTSQSVKVVGAGPTTGVTVAASQAALIAWDGTDFKLVATNDLSAISGLLPISKGGTGLTTIPARSTLIANALDTLTTITPGAGQSIRINAGNTAWEAYTPTTGTGDVTASASNAFTGANTFFNSTGQTIGTGTSANDGIVLAGRAGGSSNYRVTIQPTTLTASRTLTLPNNSGTVLTTGAAVTETQGGTGTTTYTTGQILYASATNTLSKRSIGANGHVLTVVGGVPDWAAPSASAGVTSFSAGSTGLTPSIATTGAVTLAGTLAVANGGTGQTSYTNGQLLIGNTTGNTLTKATLTAGTGVSITNGTGSITIDNSGVTSFSAGTTGLTPSTGTTGSVTLAGTLATANGGTNLTSFTSGGVLYATSTSALTTSSSLTYASSTLTVSGGITLSGTSRRITGDMSNATVASRVFAQTSTSNSSTSFGLLPNGTSTSAGFVSFNNSTPTNASFAELSISSTVAIVGSQFVGSGSALPLTFAIGGSEVARFATSGEFYIAGTTDQGAYNLQCNGTGVWGAGAYVNGSDSRIKDDITPLQDGLNVVTQLKPVTFKYKQSWASKEQEIQPGFIAQDLQDAFAGKNYVDGVVKQGGEYLSVAYQTLIPVLTKAIQELKAELDTIKAEVAALKGN